MAPDRADTPDYRLSLLERDREHHSSSITNLTLAVADIHKDKAVQEVKDEYLDERLKRLESRIDAVYRLGIWVLSTFGAILIALVANFIFKGGLILAS